MGSPIWGLRSREQFLRFLRPAHGPRGAGRTEVARRSPPAEADGLRSIGIMLGGEVRIGTHRRREVVDGRCLDGGVAQAHSADRRCRIRRRGRAHSGAGVDGGRPCAAGAPPGSSGAYVALTARATCVAIVRDGLLSFARAAVGVRGRIGGRCRIGAPRLGIAAFGPVLQANVRAPGRPPGVVACDTPTCDRSPRPLGEALTLPGQNGRFARRDRRGGDSRARGAVPRERGRAAHGDRSPRERSRHRRSTCCHRRSGPVASPRPPPCG